VSRFRYSTSVWRPLVREKRNKAMRKEFVRAVAGYALAAALSVVFLVFALQLWKADLRVPFLYWEDALLVDSWVKGVLDNGWYLHNPYLAAPAAQDFHDFPLADNLHFALIKLLGLV